MEQRNLAAMDVLKYHPGHLCDPPPWFIRELDFRVLRKLAINEVQMHRAILSAQVEAANKTLEILESVKG